MFRTFFLSLLLVALINTPTFALEFKCDAPQFGTPLSSFSNKDNFIKYKEKGGVSYYNFTGKCEIPIHTKTNPAMSYGFVDDKLYARIVSYSVEGNPKEFKAYLLENVKSILGDKIGDKFAKKPKMKLDGDWSVYNIDMKDLGLKMKAKYNHATKQYKNGLYYQPLRKQLNLNKQ